MRTIDEITHNGRSLADILSDHAKWWKEPSGAETHEKANLSEADLRWADLREANLREANLRGANLTGANLTGADLSGANLREADLTGADLTGANLSGANLRGADLSGANLSGANLSGADLRAANLRAANLRAANLREADLREADLTGADLTGANLSGVQNLLNPVKWLAEHFEHDDDGYIVYKAIGDTTFAPPARWKIEAGEYLDEVCNPLPTLTCACGVNFATLDWVKENHPRRTIWRCRIRWMDLPGVVVPYNTDGKARCNRLELLEVVG